MCFGLTYLHATSINICAALVIGGGADFVLWIDYLIHIQNSVGDTRIGLVFSEDEKKKTYGVRQNRVI